MQLTSDLGHFVRDALNKGRSEAEIRAALEASDWTALEIETALEGWQYRDGLGAVPRPHRSTAAWDALFYALLFAAFGMMIGHTLHQLLGAITALIPDPNETFSYRDLGGLRWSMAAVIVFTPTFLWLNRKDARASVADPARRHGTVRRWLATLAIFAAAITLMCDAIFVIQAFLSGDVTPRFLAKAGAVALIACVVLIYFRQDRQRKQTTRNPGAVLATALAALALGLSFWLVGGPGQGQREHRDSLRLSDMRLLANDLERCETIRSGALPETLDPMDCARNPDRMTGLAREITYQRLDETRYALCVRLEAPDRARDRFRLYQEGDLHCREEARD